MSNKPKRRAYLLKRKALTTGFFDNKAKDDKEKGKLLLLYSFDFVDMVISNLKLSYSKIFIMFFLVYSISLRNIH